MLEIFVKATFGVLAEITQETAKALYEFWAGPPVRYRDTIKLRHVATGGSLHSHALNYTHPGTSGQQQVTVFDGADNNDLWIVKGPNGQPEMYKEGLVIRQGDVIRLEHLTTKRNLHSHNKPSPLTSQQEVTAFGENGAGDFNDNWRVEVLIGREWRENVNIRLIHVESEHALHSHKGHKHPEYTADQQEVTAYKLRDDNDLWRISK